MLSKYLCYLIGHQYIVVEELVDNFKRVKCQRCEKEWLAATNRKSFVPWKDYFKGETDD